MQPEKNKPTKLTRVCIAVLLFMFSLTFLSSCAVWVRGPGYRDNDHGRHGNNDRHHGENH